MLSNRNNKTDPALYIFACEILRILSMTTVLVLSLQSLKFGRKMQVFDIAALSNKIGLILMLTLQS